MTTTRLLALALTAAALGVCGLAAPAAQAQQPAATSTGAMPVAVIDMDRLLRDSAIAKSLNEQVASTAAVYRQQLDQLQKDMESLRQQLREANADTPAAREARTQLTIKNATAQSLVQTANQETNRVISVGTLKMINAVKDAVEKVAQQRQIGLVLRKAPPVPTTFDPTNEQQARQAQEALPFQIALYAAPSLDITSEVMLKMDEAFKSAGSTGQ